MIFENRTDKNIFALIKRFAKNKTSLLEAGSNTGHFSKKLAKRGFNVTLLDRIEEPILIAKKEFLLKNIKGEFVVSDILDFTGLYDLVWNTGVIQCYPKDIRKKLVLKLCELGNSILFIFPNVDENGFNKQFDVTKPPGIGNCIQYNPDDIIELVSTNFFVLRVGQISSINLGLPYSMTYIYAEGKRELM
jgi:SAM-dependent methyltransferase